MTLERELVFDLRSKGSNEKDVLEIVAYMGNSDIFKTTPVKLNSRLIKVALTQYQAREELKKRKDYVKTDREKLKELIEEKTEEIRNTTENLLSVKIDKRDRWYGCNNCGGTSNHYYAMVTNLNGKGGIPTPMATRKSLFLHCNKCGYIQLED